MRGVEAQKQFTAAFHLAFPDFQVTYEEEIIQGTTSCHRWTCSATFSGSSPLLPVPPNGKLLTAQGCHVVHWEAGKVVEAWHFGDWLGWLQQAGLLPPSAHPPRTRWDRWEPWVAHTQVARKQAPKQRLRMMAQGKHLVGGDPVH